MTRRPKGVLTLLVLLALWVGACAVTPTEIKYRCILPKTAAIDADPDLGTVFANAIAAKAKLEFLNQTRLKGMVANDVTYIVSLRSSSAQGVFVNVLFNRPYRTMALTISGDVGNPEAGLIAQRSIKVFATLFPGSTLAPFSGNQALFGP
jgi:hypothetical protein